MATDKKSFILYADQKELFDQLPDDKAGELIKHIFKYVNDENPINEDLIINLAFTSIKQQLKRDLVKYEGVKDKKSIAGREGNLKRWHVDLYDDYQKEIYTLEAAEIIAKDRKASHTDKVPSHPIAKIAVNDNDNDNVNVNDNVKENKDIKKPTAFNFRNSFLNLGVNNDILNDWLDVRKKRKSANSKTAFSLFINEVGKSKLSVSDAVELCAGKSWASFNHKWELNLPIVKVENPNNEEIVKYKDNVGNTGSATRSKYKEMVIRNHEGGYIYTEIK
tara:strand:+ start:107 stop:937 length:831 start_codon:yes stop_codon:yes gene_type:complete